MERETEIWMSHRPYHTLRSPCQHQQLVVPTYLHHLPPRPEEPAPHFTGCHWCLHHHPRQGGDASSHLLQGRQEPQQQHGGTDLWGHSYSSCVPAQIMQVLIDMWCIFSHFSGDPQSMFVTRSLWLRQTQSHTKQVKWQVEFVLRAKSNSEVIRLKNSVLLRYSSCNWTCNRLFDCLTVQGCCVGTLKRTTSPSPCLSPCLCSACPWGQWSSAGQHTPNTPCQFFPHLSWRVPLERRYKTPL